LYRDGAAFTTRHDLGVAHPRRRYGSGGGRGCGQPGRQHRVGSCSGAGGKPEVAHCLGFAARNDDRDRAYFGRQDQDTDQIGFIDAQTQAIFGRTYAAEPDVLISQLKEDEAIAAADTLLLTVPNQLGVDYNTHVIDSILTHVAPALGWR